MRFAQRLMTKFPDKAPYISVSLHCELAEILNAYTKIVEREGKLTGLSAYSAARPPHSEGLAIQDRLYLANETNCLNMTCCISVRARPSMRHGPVPQCFRISRSAAEVTVGHLLLDTSSMCRSCQGQPANSAA